MLKSYSRLPTIDRSAAVPAWQPHQHADAVSVNIRDFVRHDALPTIHHSQTSHGEAAHDTATPQPALQSITENRLNYQKQPLFRQRHRIKRGLLTFSSDPFVCGSQYKDDFVQLKPDRTDSFKPAYGTHLSNAPFEGMSTYKHHFNKWTGHHETHSRPVAANAAANEENFPSGQAPMPFNPARTLNGVTEYGNSYHGWRAAEHRTIPPEYNPPTETFGGATSYNDTYHVLPYSKPRPFDPTVTAFSSDAPFEATSLYRDDFVPKSARPSSVNILTNKGSVLHRSRPSNVAVDYPVEVESYTENAGAGFQSIQRKPAQRVGRHNGVKEAMIFTDA